MLGSWPLLGVFFVFSHYPKLCSNVCSRLKQSSKCLLQRTEFSMGFLCARVRCSCFAHFSLRKGSLGKLKRLTPSQCVLEHTAATQRVSMVLELVLSRRHVLNHTHNRIWILMQTGNRKGQKYKPNFGRNGGCQKSETFSMCLVWPKLLFKNTKWKSLLMSPSL